MRGLTVPRVGEGANLTTRNATAKTPQRRVKSVSLLLLLLLLGNDVFFLPAVTGIEFYLLTSRQWLQVAHLNRVTVPTAVPLCCTVRITKPHRMREGNNCSKISNTNNTIHILSCPNDILNK